MSDNKLLTPKEVSERLNVGRQALYRWAEQGKLNPVVLPSGRHRYRPEDIEALINANTGCLPGVSMTGKVQ